LTLVRRRLFTIQYNTKIYKAHIVCQLAESEARAVTGGGHMTG